MDEVELNAIRAARLQELQRNAGQSPSGQAASLAGGQPRNGGGGGEDHDAMSSILDQILEPEAMGRLSRVRLVRPDRAKAVEQYLVRLVQSGQVRRKLQEKDIMEILDGLARDEQKRNETKIVFSRKNVSDDDDDDFFD